MTRAVIDALTRLTLRHSRRIVLFAAILAAVGLVAASRVTLNPDMLDFVPGNAREVRELRRVVTALGSIDHHLVVVKIPKGASAADYAPLVDRMAAHYSSLPDVAEVQYRLPDVASLADELLPRAFLLLGPERLDEIGACLSDEAIRDAMARNRALLETPQSSIAKHLMRLDPLGLYTVFLDRFRPSAGQFRFDATSGYFLSADRTAYLLLVRPKRPAQDLPFVSELMESSRAIEQRVVGKFSSEHSELRRPEIAYGGGYAINEEDKRLIRSDMIANVGVSFVGVLLLLYYAFRRVSAVAYAAIPMALAIILTFAIAALTLGSLSAASAGFGALLAGLGIDFFTVLYARYLEERGRGAGVTEAIFGTMRQTLPGVITAALTTAATFYGFLATEFRGMMQMGFLTGTGILVFLGCVAFIMPALLVMGERGEDRRPGALLRVAGVASLTRVAIRRPVATVLIWCAAVVCATAASWRLEYDDDAGKIRSTGNRGVQTQEYVASEFGTAFNGLMVVSEGRTTDEALARSSQTVPLLDRLSRDKAIGSYQSLAAALPSVERQTEVMRRLEEGRTGPFDPDRIEARFREAVVQNGFRADAWDSYLERLRLALTPSEVLRVGDLHSEAVQEFVDRFVHRDRDGWLAVTYVYPPGRSWRRTTPEELIRGAEAVPQTFVTGVPIVSAELRRIARRDAIRATIIGSVVVIAILAVSFRSFRYATLVFVPLLAGTVGMFGAMALLGLPFNLLNSFVGLMLVGVATDYAVYVLQRFLESPSTFAESGPETGKAVAMAALMTIVGYGSFAISHYPGLRSIGYASALGVGFSGLAAITLLPALLVLKQRDELEERNDDELATPSDADLARSSSFRSDPAVVA